MTWDQRLKRVFKIDIESCEQCGGATLIYRESRHSVPAYQHYLNARCWPKAPVRPDSANVRNEDTTDLHLSMTNGSSLPDIAEGGFIGASFRVRP
jgi:hypothetical protein